MATHSSILAWKISWIEEPGELQSMLLLLSHFSRVQLTTTPRTVARQAPLSVGFSRHEYWNGLPCLPPGDLPNPGIKPMLSALAGGFFYH